MTLTKKLLLLTILILVVLEVRAEKKTEVVIDSISFKELADLTASKKPVVDENGESCALIKVYAPLFREIKLTGSSIFKQEQKSDAIWLWVLNGTKKITVSASDMRPVEIVFSDYNYPTLHSKATYQLDLTKGNEQREKRYRTIIEEETKVKYKTKYIDTYHFEEAETYCFLSFQYEYGFPFGLNFGACKKYGAFVFVNYVDSDIQFGWEEDKVNDGSQGWRHLITFGGGPMFRLSSRFYLQTGIGLSTDGEDAEWYFTAGTSCLFKHKRLIVGLGYYYNGSSSYYNRDVLLDGITMQLGINF